MRVLSPFRYPGGKASWAGRLTELVDRNGSSVLFEPFAGGAGAGLALLESKAVGELWLTEANPAVHAAWASMLSDPESFARRIESTRPSLDDFVSAQELLRAGCDDRDELGWAAFLVNRCSFSGIVSGRRVGPIGGWGQRSAYRVDARWMPATLARRVRHLGSLAARIRLEHADGIAGIETLSDARVFVFADPPYVTKEADKLYAFAFGADDHARLARALLGSSNPWALAYDDHADVRALYTGSPIAEIEVGYSVARARKTNELLVTSHRTGSNHI